MSEPKRKRGGQPVDNTERLIGRSIRMKQRHWDKINSAGMEWLRALVEKAKPPQKPEG